MPKYLTIHRETAVDRILLESRWSEISVDPRADWEVTLFNLEQGRRWCEWDAPDTQTIEQILNDLGIKWTEILEVEVTTPSQWRLWEVQTRRQGPQPGWCTRTLMESSARRVPGGVRPLVAKDRGGEGIGDGI